MGVPEPTQLLGVVAQTSPVPGGSEPLSPLPALAARLCRAGSQGTVVLTSPLLR